jgi:hypothetical protein
VDLIQNWPDLSRPPWSFVSHGPEADEAFVRKIDPAAVREWADEHSSLWRIDPEKARLDPNRGPVP